MALLNVIQLKQDVYTRNVLPNKKLFQRLNERLRETGSFKKQVSDSGKPMNVRTVNCEERILNHIEEDNRTSTRRIAAMENVGHMTDTPRTTALSVSCTTCTDTSRG